MIRRLRARISLFLISVLTALIGVIALPSSPAAAANYCYLLYNVPFTSGVSSNYHMWVTFAWAGAGTHNMYFEQNQSSTGLVEWNSASYQVTGSYVEAVVYNDSGRSGDMPSGWLVDLYSC